MAASSSAVLQGPRCRGQPCPQDPETAGLLFGLKGWHPPPPCGALFSGTVVVPCSASSPRLRVLGRDARLSAEGQGEKARLRSPGTPQRNPPQPAAARGQRTPAPSRYGRSTRFSSIGNLWTPRPSRGQGTGDRAPFRCRKDGNKSRHPPRKPRPDSFPSLQTGRRAPDPHFHTEAQRPCSGMRRRRGLCEERVRLSATPVAR